MTHADHADTSHTWFGGQLATGKRFIPNVPVETHRGERKMFYDDLIRGKTVIVQFMSIAHHARYPVTRNLQNVQRLLGDRAGREVFLYSVTADPVHDTPAALAAFASKYSPGPGWSFLSGDAAVLAALKGVFFYHPGGHGHHAAHAGQGADAAQAPQPDCSLGLMRYGNDVTGLWASVPTKADPALIVERLSWLQPQKRPPQRRAPKRRGPTATTHRSSIVRT